MITIEFKSWFKAKPNYEDEGSMYMISTPSIIFFKYGKYWSIGITFLFWELTIEHEI